MLEILSNTFFCIDFYLFKVKIIFMEDLEYEIQKLFNVSYNQMNGSFDFKEPNEIRTWLDQTSSNLDYLGNIDLINIVENKTIELSAEITLLSSKIDKFKGEYKNSFEEGYVYKLQFLKANYETGVKWVSTRNKELQELEDDKGILADLDFKVTERIILLHKLGVLDFLREQRPFNYSLSNLSTIIGGVIGSKSSTVNSYLNPIYSPKVVSQKNNPLKNKEKNDEITMLLTKMGFSLKD